MSIPERQNFFPVPHMDFHIQSHKVHLETKSTFGGKLVDVVKQIIGVKIETKTHSELLLARIYEVHSKSKEAVAYLQNVRVALSETVHDPKIKGEVETVIDLMIKEITRIHKGIDTTKNPAQQEELLKKYFTWVENVKQFIKALNEDGVEEAVKQQGIKSATDLIDRDIDLLEKLREHDVPQISTITAKEQLQKIFDVSISALQRLKSPPEQLTAEQLSGWKIKLDASRENHFNEALAQIEKFMESSSKSSS